MSEAITLGSAAGSVGLTPVGPVGVGSPALVTVRAGSLRVDRETELLNLDGFCDAVAELHRTLAGAATLTTLECDFELTLKAESTGKVDVAAKLFERSGGLVEYDLNVRFDLDQSYLPSFVGGVRAQFLQGVIQ
jgi:hypothetical protein